MNHLKGFEETFLSTQSAHKRTATKQRLRSVWFKTNLIFDFRQEQHSG